MTLSENFGFRYFVSGRGTRQWLVIAALLAAASVQAQVVKAPRYSGNTAPVEAPTMQVVLPPLPPALTPHGTVVEDVVVQVNDQIISRSDVDRSEEQLHTGGRPAEPFRRPTWSPADAQKNMLRDMIDQQLLLSSAPRSSVSTPTQKSIRPP